LKNFNQIYENKEIVYVKLRLDGEVGERIRSLVTIAS